ncbi:MAG: tetratricopeptide repeat protein [Melioribacter sp.]|uniref:tetratricopeptide repeat protein n=1 Tax=Rosettibacter primus TaxID=3111523 RepID=UPI00247C335D|nr:tetratricopeptide repeat protein [Melioribacter sp.]
MNTKIFLFFLLTSLVHAQNYDWVRHDSLVKAGVNQIYGIEFDKAEKTFDIVIKEYPNHPSGKFFKAMITWWRILLNLEDESMDQKFYNQLQEVIDMCDKILDKNPKNIDAIFFKGGSIGFRGRLLGIRENWIKAALDGKEGLDLVYRAYKADPKNVDVQLGFGIYHYYAEVIPQRYPAVKPFMVFFPQGDKKRGLKELENVAWNGRYARIESRYFLMTLNFQFENDMDEARKWGRLLLSDFPNNPNFQKYYGLTFVKENDYKEAAKIFRDIYKKCEKGFQGYNKRFKREASYYLGMDYKISEKVDSAIYYFEICEKLSREIDKKTESGFLINTVLYLAMLYDQKGQRDKAISYYNEVLRMRDRNNSHELARMYLKVPYRK